MTHSRAVQAQSKETELSLYSTWKKFKPESICDLLGGISHNRSSGQHVQDQILNTAASKHDFFPESIWNPVPL